VSREWGRVSLERVIVVKEMIYKMRKVIKEKDILKGKSRNNRWIF
jgi:hypothetical protein